MLFATRKTSIISRNDTLNRKTTKKRKKKTSSDATNTTTNDFHSENANVNSSRTSTAKLIETVASSILSFNLKKQTSVTVSVNSDDFEALTRGKVREVQIKGTDWSSKKNLTCKSLDISVGEVEVDYGKIVTTGRIEIKKPGGRGRAKLFMSFEDFRNFLKHPLTNEALNEVRMTFEDEAPKRALEQAFAADGEEVPSLTEHERQFSWVADIADAVGWRKEFRYRVKITEHINLKEARESGKLLADRTYRTLSNGLAAFGGAAPRADAAFIYALR